MPPKAADQIVNPIIGIHPPTTKIVDENHDTYARWQQPRRDTY